MVAKLVLRTTPITTYYVHCLTGPFHTSNYVVVIDLVPAQGAQQGNMDQLCANVACDET